MKEEISEFEYREVIIPLHEELIEKDIILLQHYSSDSIEHTALKLAIALKSTYVEWVKAYINKEPQDVLDQLNDEQLALEEKIDEIGVDVSEIYKKHEGANNE